MVNRCEILNACTKSKNGSIIVERNFKKKYADAYNEICGIDYPNDFSFKQKLYHYLNNDDELKLGVCKICGKRCKLISFKEGYHTYCCNSCSQLDAETRDKIKNTCVERYGVEAYSQSNDWKNSLQDTWSKKDVVEINERRSETKQRLYGDKHYNNNERIRKTLNLKSSSEKQEVVEKTRNTKLERYGNENYVNIEKIKVSWAEKSDDEKRVIVEKARQTKLERYGDCNFNGRDKSRLTCMERYGVCNPSLSETIKHKKKTTFIERYGVENPMLNEGVVRKSIKSKQENEISKKGFLMGYTENGDWICRCENPFCNMCDEKTYITTCFCYDDRKIKNYETCTKLNPIGVQSSGLELELIDFVKSIYDGEIIEHDRNILNGKELDVYIPEKGLAIEFNSVYWHSEVYKNTNYHYDKSAECMEKGVQLLHIWEDDWIEKKDIVKNLIKGKLGLQSRRFNARECVIREIDTNTAKCFCEKYHIQGYTNSLVKLGLFKDDELLMVALFGQGRKISGGGRKDGEWELYRLCSPFGTLVRGGASKLIQWFINKNNPNAIITFADLSVSNGNLYEKIGFEKKYIVPPTYYWCIGNKRYPRYRFQKSNLEECKANPNLTENEVMHDRGYYKVYDAGKIKYIMNI